jgi:hypothetical protein
MRAAHSVSVEAEGFVAAVLREHPDVEGSAAALRHLRAACTAMDQVGAARRRLEADGQIVLDRHGEPRAHPALKMFLVASRCLVDNMAALMGTWHARHRRAAGPVQTSARALARRDA